HRLVETDQIVVARRRATAAEQQRRDDRAHCNQERLLRHSVSSATRGPLGGTADTMGASSAVVKASLTRRARVERFPDVAGRPAATVRNFSGRSSRREGHSGCSVNVGATEPRGARTMTTSGTAQRWSPLLWRSYTRGFRIKTAAWFAANAVIVIVLG